MKKTTLLGFSLGVITLLFTGCETTQPTVTGEDDFVEYYTVTKSIAITYSKTGSASVPETTTGVDISIDGNFVTINSTIEGIEYVVSGETTNGQLKIYSAYKFKLTLNGVTLQNPTGSAINIQSGKRVFVELADGTTNTLQDASTYSSTLDTEDEKGCFFSEGQLIFSGNGMLSIASNYKHAICSDDYIRVRSGNITITQSASDGIHAKDYFQCDGGNLTITTTGEGSDGIDVSEGHIIINGGNITIHSVDKGIVASFDPLTSTETVIPYITVNEGTIIINTNSTKAHGINTTDNFTINRGTISITTVGTKSDGINVDGSITLNGGTITISATDDCVMGTLVENGGSLICG